MEVLTATKMRILGRGKKIRDFAHEAEIQDPLSRWTYVKISRILNGFQKIPYNFDWISNAVFKKWDADDMEEHK